MHWRETSDLVVSGNPQLDRIEVSLFTNRETAIKIYQSDRSDEIFLNRILVGKFLICITS